jgi:hypothetical protein
MALKKSTRGLLLRKGVWHIDKVLFGKLICESTHTANLGEAEMLLEHRCFEVRRRSALVSRGGHQVRCREWASARFRSR